MKALATEIAVLAGALALAGCGSGSGKVPVSSPLKLCPPQPTGALCIKVFQANHAVGDVIGYLSASNSPLAGKTWRLILSRYGCDPGSAAQATCRVTATYPDRTRQGPPPIQTFCRETTGGTTVTVTTAIGCHDTFGSAYASNGEWSGFSVPKKFGSRVWLCVSEEIRTGDTWGPPSQAIATKPVRACAAVGPT